MDLFQIKLTDFSIEFVIYYLTIVIPTELTLVQSETFTSVGRKMSYRTSIWSSSVVCCAPPARLACLATNGNLVRDGTVKCTVLADSVDL